MNPHRKFTLIKGPHISEKSTVVADKHKQIVLKVATNATKHEIAKAVESLFEVKVKNVTVVNGKGKQKRFAQRQGKRSDYKKAYVSLQEGYDINFATTE